MKSVRAGGGGGGAEKREGWGGYFTSELCACIPHRVTTSGYGLVDLQQQIINTLVTSFH